MKQPLDKITEAYYDGIGEEFGGKVRRRIHWICSQAKGERILDIGCSQGITSILLGREGKKVLGIDLLEESIEYANKSLESETEITKQCVEFKTANFMTFDLEDETYDSIIISEVLEHLTDPERFIEKAGKLIEENGRVIITVPFGINDYFDHKKTYYLLDIAKKVEKFLDIETIKFFGKWIGVIAKNKTDNAKENIINNDTLFQLEKEFYKIERSLVDTIQKKDINYDFLKEKYIKAEENYKKMKENYNNLNLRFMNFKENEDKENNSWKIAFNDKEEKIKELKLEIEEYQNAIEKTKSNYENILKEKDEKIKELELEIEQYQIERKELKIDYNNEINNKQKKNSLKEQLKINNEKISALQEANRIIVNKSHEYLNKIEELIMKNFEVSKKREELIKRTEELYSRNNLLVDELKSLKQSYSALRKSKLGRITILIWRLKKKIKKIFK